MPGSLATKKSAFTERGATVCRYMPGHVATCRGNGRWMPPKLHSCSGFSTDTLACHMCGAAIPGSDGVVVPVVLVVLVCGCEA